MARGIVSISRYEILIFLLMYWCDTKPEVRYLVKTSENGTSDEAFKNASI